MFASAKPFWHGMLEIFQKSSLGSFTYVSHLWCPSKNGIFRPGSRGVARRVWIPSEKIWTEVRMRFKFVWVGVPIFQFKKNLRPHRPPLNDEHLKRMIHFLWRFSDWGDKFKEEVPYKTIVYGRNFWTTPQKNSSQIHVPAQKKGWQPLQ